MKIRIIIAFVIFLLKSNLFAQDVNFEWANRIGGTESDRTNSIAIDLEGNVYITGIFSDTVDFDPSEGIFNLVGPNDYVNIFITKFNTSGQLLWAKYIGKGGGTSIIIDALGQPTITGSFIGEVDFDPNIGEFILSADPSGIFVLRLNKDGEFIWAKSFGTGGGIALSADKEGNIVIIGQFHGTSDFDPGLNTFNLTANGHDDNFISKLDSNGIFIWAKQFGSSGYDEITSLAIDSFGDIYIGGNFYDTVDFDPGPGVVNLYGSDFSQGWDGYLLKLNNFGEFEWVHKISNECRAITVDYSNNVIFTGRFLGTVDFDPGNSINNLTSSGVDDIFVLKLDPSGNFIWAKSIGGTSNDIVNSVTTDKNNYIYTTGSFFLTSDFDPSIEEYNLTAIGANDIYVLKLDSSGNFIWAKQFGGNWNEEGHAIATDNSGNVYTCGSFHLGTVDFDPGADTFNLSSAGSYDMFHVKLSQGTVGVTEEFVPLNVSTIFPNPSTGHLWIEPPFKNLHEKINISIYTMEGILLKEYSENIQQKLYINISDQPQGMYIIKLSSGTENFTSKVSLIR